MGLYEHEGSNGVKRCAVDNVLFHFYDHSSFMSNVLIFAF